MTSMLSLRTSLLLFYFFLYVQNINRAIKRATEKDAGDFSESTFEAYGHGGASLIINVLSDNPNRSTADVRSAVSKGKGKMAEQGSVLFMYDLKGKVEIPAVVDEEDLMMAAIDAGVDDMELVEVRCVCVCLCLCVCSFFIKFEKCIISC